MPTRAPTPRLAARRMIGARRRAIVVIAALLVVLPVVANGWAVSRSRHAMVAAVEKAELAAARSAAADSATNLRAAVNLADAAAHRPGLAGRVKARDRFGVLSALDSVGSVSVFRGLVVFDDEGVIAATGSNGLPADPSAWQPGLHAVPGDIVYTTSILDEHGVRVGGLAAQFDIDQLLPQLLNTRYGRSGSASLVTPDGVVVVSGVVSRRGLTVQASAVRSLLASHREGVAQHTEPLMHGAQISAVAPIDGHPWSVLVGADDDEASGPASALSHRLAVGFSLVFLLCAGLLVLLVRMVAANRRTLERLGARAYRLARTDPLTGIANRRALEQHLSAALADLRAAGEPVTVTLIDLDAFKELNDVHGHQAGDDGLRAMADALEAAVRDVDLVARLGGDEFAVVQRGVDAASAALVVERLRRQLGHPLDGRRPLAFSAGVAVAEPGDDVATLVQRADQALYRDKRARKAQERERPGKVIVLTH